MVSTPGSTSKLNKEGGTDGGSTTISENWNKDDDSRKYEGNDSSDKDSEDEDENDPCAGCDANMNTRYSEGSLGC